MRVKKPSFAIILFSGKTLADGTRPVMIRATYNRERRYYSLGLTATPEQWNTDLGRYQAKRLTEDQRNANHELGGYSVRLKAMDEYFTNVDFTFDRFERKFFKTSSGKVFEYFGEVIAELENDNRLGSADTYKGCLSRLKAFRSKDFTWHDVDLKFLQQFERFLKPNTTATIGIYMRVLRAVFNRAISEGLIKQDVYPFKAFTIKTETSRKKALTKEQINALKSYKSTRGSRQWHHLNLFLFSYYARGMNLSDMAALKWPDIRNGRIFYKRNKTGDNIDMAIDENLAKILAEYSSGDYVFPILETGLKPSTERHRKKSKLKKINKDLQEIAAAINLDPKSKIKELTMPEDITFYVARHSFATALKRAGVGISVIQETLGHSSESVTKNYLASFETSELDKISEHL